MLEIIKAIIYKKKFDNKIKQKIIFTMIYIKNNCLTKVFSFYITL